MKLIAALTLASLGLLAILLPMPYAHRISNFYRRYPLIRHAPAAQFKLHPHYIRILGLTTFIAAATVLMLD